MKNPSASDNLRGFMGVRPMTMAALVALVTGAIFFSATQCEFVNFDDDGYVTANRHVLGGLNWKDFCWAWTTIDQGNWHPLTWLSLQFDALLWDNDPFGFHLTNVLLHSTTAGLIYWTFARWTGRPDLSAALALFWGVHPMHVESVVWVSERKDVLSGLLWMMTLLAYSRFAASPSLTRMLGVAAVFLAGLAAKPMLITLPCVLILLDFWPLNRVNSLREFMRRLVEKWPLYLAMLLSAFATIHAQGQSSAIRDLDDRPILSRFETTLVAYEIYLKKTAFPMDLAVFYPHPNERPAWVAFSAFAVIASLTVGAILLRRKASYFLVGWLWFLGTLVPVIGLIQVGGQEYADRYVYIPHIGLFLAVVWSVGSLIERYPVMSRPILVFAALAWAACAIQTSRQIEVWTDSNTLWTHAWHSTENNFLVNDAMGNLLRIKQDPECMKYYDEATRLNPNDWTTAYHRSMALTDLRRFEEAEAEIERAMKFTKLSDLGRAKLWWQRAQISAAQGKIEKSNGRFPAAQEKFEEAIGRLDRAINHNPEFAELHRWRGLIAESIGRRDEAIADFTAVLELQPDHELRIETAVKLSNLLLDAERAEEAARWIENAEASLDASSAATSAPMVLRGHFAQSLLIRGNKEEARREAVAISRSSKGMDLVHDWVSDAWKAAVRVEPGVRNPPRALRLAKLASLTIEPNHNVVFLDVLAAAYAANGLFDEATSAGEEATRLAELGGDKSLAIAIGKRVELYRKREKYIEVAPNGEESRRRN